MTAWVVRKSLEGTAVSGPGLCAEPGRIVRQPGLLTMEELFPHFLGEGETVDGFIGPKRFKIMQAGRVVGYLEILDGDR
jgi:hypothetical protein